MPSYVGKNSSILIVFAASKDQILQIAYSPTLKVANYRVYDFSINSTNEKGFETAIKDVCDDGYYKNDLEDIQSVFIQLAELFT